MESSESSAYSSNVKWHKKVSFKLLALAAYLMGGLTAAAIVFSHSYPIPESIYVREYRISSPQSLNNVLAGIGLFNSGLSYCFVALVAQIAAKIRTRMAKKGTSLANLLNSLPNSPDWKGCIRPGVALTITSLVAVVMIINAGVGVLYKEGLVLSEILLNGQNESFPYNFVTGCDYQLPGRNTSDVCLFNKYTQYGLALSAAHLQSGDQFTVGIEDTKVNNTKVSMLTYVGAPKLSAVDGAFEINATTLGVITWFRNLTAAESAIINNTKPSSSSRSFAIPPLAYAQAGWPPTLQPVTKREIPASKVAQSQNKNLTLNAWLNTGGFDWILKLNGAGNDPQFVGGKSSQCAVDCTWRNASFNTLPRGQTRNQYNQPVEEEDTYYLDQYVRNDDKCATIHNGFWADNATVDYNWGDIWGMFISDFQNRTDSKNGLSSAYIMAVIYSVHMFNGENNFFNDLANNTATAKIVSNDQLSTSVMKTSFVIQTKVWLWIYIGIICALVPLLIALAYEGDVLITPWAPLWIGMMDHNQRDLVSTQVRANPKLKRIVDGENVGENIGRCVWPFPK